MIKGKELQKIIKALVEKSFRDRSLVESQFIKSIKILKSQKSSQAILALGEYLKQLRRKQRQHTLYIETAIPLAFIQLKKIKKIIEKKVKITQVVTNINPEILGGFKLRVGDEVWDDSVMGKIYQLKEGIIGG